MKELLIQCVPFNVSRVLEFLDMFCVLVKFIFIRV